MTQKTGKPIQTDNNEIVALILNPFSFVSPEFLKHNSKVKTKEEIAW